MILTFQPWIHPELKRSRLIEKVEHGKINVRYEKLAEEHPIARIAILPQEGKIRAKELQREGFHNINQFSSIVKR
jgi:hypothetical protein